MQRALYHPTHGYYRSAKVRQGPRGDYITSPTICPLFAQCIANHIAPLLRQNPTWSIAEIGPGSGDLACDLLQSLHANNQLPVEYFLVEPSPQSQIIQSQRVSQSPASLQQRLQWSEHIPNGFEGIIIANEILDALPVHLLETCPERHLQSVQVEHVSGSAQWALTPPDSRVVDALSARNIPLYPNYRYEISLETQPFLEEIAQRMTAGICLLFDYGYSRSEYYHPQRKRGTLTAYSQHRQPNDLLAQPGKQDISCHVDFNLVTDVAIACGFEINDICTQEFFLYQNGLAQVLQDQASGLNSLDYQRIRHAAYLLTAPEEMGTLVKVVSLSKSI